jgi:hypothetical protein
VASITGPAAGSLGVRVHAGGAHSAPRVEGGGVDLAGGVGGGELLQVDGMS